MAMTAVRENAPTHIMWITQNQIKSDSLKSLLKTERGSHTVVERGNTAAHSTVT